MLNSNSFKHISIIFWQIRLNTLKFVAKNRKHFPANVNENWMASMHIFADRISIFKPNKNLTFQKFRTVLAADVSVIFNEHALIYTTEKQTFIAL